MNSCFSGRNSFGRKMIVCDVWNARRWRIILLMIVIIMFCFVFYLVILSSIFFLYLHFPSCCLFRQFQSFSPKIVHTSSCQQSCCLVWSCDFIFLFIYLFILPQFDFLFHASYSVFFLVLSFVLRILALGGPTKLVPGKTEFAHPKKTSSGRNFVFQIKRTNEFAELECGLYVVLFCFFQVPFCWPTNERNNSHRWEIIPLGLWHTMWHFIFL